MSYPEPNARGDVRILDGYGLLYVSTMLVVSVAPSMGVAGTAARVACACLAAMALVHTSLQHAARRLRASQLAACCLLLVALLLAAASPVGSAYAASRLLNWLMFASLIVLFYRRPRYGSLAVAAILVGLTQVVGVLLQQRGYMSGTWGGALISGTDYNRQLGTWLTRYTGFVRDPNNLAVLMNITAVACLAVLYSSRRKALRLLMLGGLVASAATIVTSGSRGGLLALPLGLLVFAFFTGARTLMRIAVFGGFAAYIALTAQWRSLDGVIHTLSDAAAGQDESLTQRFATWEKYRMAAHQWVFGQGFGGYNEGALAGTGFDVAKEAARQATVDNSWLKLFLEAGLFGVVGAVLVLSAAWFALLRAKKAGASGAVTGAVAAALLILVWRSVSTDVLDMNPFNAMVPLLIGAAFSIGSVGPGPQGRSTSRSALRKRAAPVHSSAASAPMARP